MVDPPYYDAIPYAHLMDFFYVWLRRSLGDIMPDLFATNLIGKDSEIVVDRPHHLSTSKKDVASKDEGHVTPQRKKREPQMDLFKVLEETDGEGMEFGGAKVERQGATVLDSIHQSMILFAAGRGEALKRFLVEDGAVKPWYKVVTPREDLREGKPLDASEFAVHLDQVREGQCARRLPKAGTLLRTNLPYPKPRQPRFRGHPPPFIRVGWTRRDKWRQS